MIDEFLNSEYNAAGELYGLDAVTRAFPGANPAQKAQIIQKIAQNNQTQISRGSRREFEKFLPQVPKHVQTEMKKGSVRLSDYTVYSIKQINSKTIKMFEPQDKKEVGVRNISDAKLPKNMVFLVSGIYLLTGENMTPTGGEGHKAIQFGSVSTIPAICNGEFSFKANRKQIIPENQAVRVFATDNDHSLPLGYFKLDNPRMIRDEELIEFTVDLGTQLGIPVNQWLMVALHGTVTTP
jgi:hypothetical protein